MNITVAPRSARRSMARAPHLLCGTLAFACVLVMTEPGCKMTPPAQTSGVHPQEDVNFSSEQVRLRVRAMVEPLSGMIIESADQVIAESTDPAVKKEALRWKIEAVPALREALFRPNPFTAIGDAWVLSWQMCDYFESERGRKALGAAASIAAATSQKLEEEITAVVTSLTKSGDVSAVRTFSRRWAKEHPIQYSIASRQSIVSRATEREVQETFTTEEVAGDVVVTMDDLTRRMGVYSEQLPEQAPWQAELMAMDMASDYELHRAMPLAEDAVHTAKDAVAVLNRLEPEVRGALTTANATPELIDHERAAMETYISKERQTVLEYVTKEREAVMAGVRAERESVLQQIATERGAVMTDMRQTIAAERDSVVDVTKGLGLTLIDHTILRVYQVSAAVLVAVFFGIIALLLIARRIFAVRPRA